MITEKRITHHTHAHAHTHFSSDDAHRLGNTFS